jgi:hypothetical protein
MTPVESLTLVYSVIRKISLNADEHDKLKEACMIIDKALAPKKDESNVQS